MLLGLALFSISLDLLKLLSAIFSLFLLSLSFLSISAASGAVFLKRRTAVGVVSGFALVAFMINAYAPAAKFLQAARLFSPFYYNSGNSPVINGLDPGLAGMQALIFIFFLIFTLLVFNKRDMTV